MFVLFALYPSPFLPRHHVTPGEIQHSLAMPKFITPTNPPLFTIHHQGSMCPHPTMPTVFTNTALQRETKLNWKETKWPHAASPVKALDRPKRRTPEEGLVEDDDDRYNKLLCYSTVTLWPLFVHLVIQNHHRANWFPCMSCLVTWQIQSNTAFYQSVEREG